MPAHAQHARVMCHSAHGCAAHPCVPPHVVHRLSHMCCLLVPCVGALLHAHPRVGCYCAHAPRAAATRTLPECCGLCLAHAMVGWAALSNTILVSPCIPTHRLLIRSNFSTIRNVTNSSSRELPNKTILDQKFFVQPIDLEYAL